MVVRDQSRPGARLLELELPDGSRVMVAEHLCGWSAAPDLREDGPLWPTVADAVRALTGRTRDGEAWISVLEEYATGLAAPPGEPLVPEDEARLREICRRAPGVYIDGPRAHNSGGWYMFIGGLQDGAWVMEYGEGPSEAAARALLHAEQVLERDAPPEP